MHCTSDDLCETNREKHWMDIEFRLHHRDRTLALKQKFTLKLKGNQVKFILIVILCFNSFRKLDILLEWSEVRLKAAIFALWHDSVSFVKKMQTCFYKHKLKLDTIIYLVSDVFLRFGKVQFCKKNWLKLRFFRSIKQFQKKMPY